MATLLVHPQKTPLTGVSTVPADKSISHRVVMLAALAEGTSRIRNWLPAGDTIATLEAIRGLGIQAEHKKFSTQTWELNIEGKGLYGLERPDGPLECRNAGTCLRLLAGILSGQRFPSILDGSSQLRKRPMRRIIEPLREMGAAIEAVDGHAPLHIRPSSLSGIDFRPAVASAQVKSAILLATLFAHGETRIRESGPARNHTENLLQAMGAPLIVSNQDIMAARPDRPLAPLDLTVPGDISSAAFLLIAAAIVPHSKIRIEQVGHNTTRTGLLDMLAAMGAHIETSGQRTSGGEPLADVDVHFDELHNTGVGGDLVVRAIDEFPVWAVAATQAAGESTVADAAELRVKEVDRISMLVAELRKMGAQIRESVDGFAIFGPTRLQGAEVDSHSDHRLGMALAVAGLVAQGPTLVQQADCIADSFPGFVETMNSLGANMEWAVQPD